MANILDIFASSRDTIPCDCMNLHQESFNIYSLLVLLGGLAIFLNGLESMSNNLKKIAGEGFKIILKNITEHRVYGVIVGTLVTAVIQSSSATTSILVSLVQSGLIQFERTVAIIMGANIGTTVTGQIVAFKVTKWALPIIFVGFMIQILASRTKTRNIGLGIIGLGFIFLGLSIMSDTMKPLRHSEHFVHLVQNLENVPLGILVGAVFTAMIQSSSATIGIMIGMATQGLISIEAGVPLILGANLGTCVTAVLASLRASDEAKRVAAAHIIFNVAGILMFMFWIPNFISFVKSFSPPDDIPRLIANAQTAFNLIATLILLAFVPQLQWLAKKVIPDRAKKKRTFVLPKAKESAHTPNIGVLHSKEGIRHLKNIVKEMLIVSRSYLIERTSLQEDKIVELRQEQKELRNELLEYLSKLSRYRMALAQSTNIMQQSEVINEIEHIAYKLEISFERMAHKIPKFQQSIDDLEEYFKKTIKYFSKACNAFINGSVSEAEIIRDKISMLKPFETEFRKKYFEKIHSGASKSHELDQVNLEVLEILRSVNSASKRICNVQVESSDSKLLI